MLPRIGCCCYTPRPREPSFRCVRLRPGSRVSLRLHMMRLCSTPYAHCFVRKSLPRSRLLPPVLHNLLCVMAALACEVPRCTRQLLFGRRGLMHSLFCPFGRHPSYKVWHRSWILATSLPAL